MVGVEVMGWAWVVGALSPWSSSLPHLDATVVASNYSWDLTKKC